MNRAVDGVDFHIPRGSVFTIVGESGCGKTTTGLLVARLLEPTAGKVYYQENDLTAMKGKQLRKMRRNISMMFQNPSAALNPRKTLKHIVGRPLEVQGIARGAERDKLVESLLVEVGLRPASKYMEKYAHDLSGGQKQRIVIARALATNPKMVVADEPVSSLDMSIKSQILNLMLDLKERLGLTYLLITHDLATARAISDWIAVMYLGRIVELAKAEEFYLNPLHPYSKALLSAVPVIDAKNPKEKLKLGAEVPDLITLPSGCRFHPRCPYAFEKCNTVDPMLRDVGDGHMVACHLY